MSRLQRIEANVYDGSTAYDMIYTGSGANDAVYNDGTITLAGTSNPNSCAVQWGNGGGGGFHDDTDGVVHGAVGLGSVEMVANFNAAATPDSLQNFHISDGLHATTIDLASSLS